MRPPSASKLACARHMVLLLLAVAITGCGSDTLAPFQPQINSAPDNFQMQATGVVHTDFTHTYSWSNSGTQATVNHSTTTTAGTAHVVIRDAAGSVVYDRALAPSLNEATAAGQAGAWTIEVALAGFSGTLNFRVQKL